MLKRSISILMLLVMLSAAACTGSETAKRAYDAPVSFSGQAHDVDVFFVNVGKADCAVVLIDGHAWLVDAGTEESFLNTYSVLELLKVKALDGVILSHGHGDHVGGLDPILKKYAVGKVFFPALQNDNSKINAVLIESGLKSEPMRAGGRIDVTDGVYFDVLGPVSLNTDNDNDNSLVLKLNVNGRSFLFTGDMQFDEETSLISAGAELLCDVLKVQNHGNPDAVSEAFADAADPLIAVISTDTSVDADSANRLVAAKLRDAEVCLTEDTVLGIWLSVSAEGVISVSKPDRPNASVTGLSFTDVSKETQSFTLKNDSGVDADLSGMCCWSTKGYEVFVFPEGTVLKSGESLTVACKISPLAQTADFVWNIKKVWADSKEDSAVLSDAYGNTVARAESR